MYRRVPSRLFLPCLLCTRSWCDCHCHVCVRPRCAYRYVEIVHLQCPGSSAGIWRSLTQPFWPPPFRCLLPPLLIACPANTCVMCRCARNRVEATGHIPACCVHFPQGCPQGVALPSVHRVHRALLSPLGMLSLARVAHRQSVRCHP